MRIVALALVGALLFSGCLGAFSGPDRASAQDLLGAAQRIARTHLGQDAVLIGAAGVEAKEDSTNHDAHRFGPDAERGDGRLPGWFYAFSSEENPDVVLTVAAAANGSLTWKHESADEGFHATPVADWQVDSDVATRELARHNATWNEWMAGQPDIAYSLWSVALETETVPIWMMWVETDGGDLGMCVVFANNGTVLGCGPFTFPMFLPPIREAGWFQGRFLPTSSASSRHTLNLAHENHDELRVRLFADGPTTGSSLNLTLTAPDGTQHGVDVTTGPSPTGASRSLRISDPEPGRYSLTITLTQGLAQDYRIAYCAPGFWFMPPPLGSNPDPCDAA